MFNVVTSNLFKKFLKLSLATSIMVFGATSALAKTIRIEVNKASILKLDEPPATVVIGNPALADVTPQPNNVLVLVGKASGRTNIIMLDENGNIKHNYDIAIQEEQSGNLTMFKAGSQWTYSCAPYCERALNPNDDGKAFGSTLSQVQAKASMMNSAAAEGAPGGSYDDSSASPSTHGGDQNAPASRQYSDVSHSLQTFTVLPPSN